MTIGMLIESLASKAGVLLGNFFDGSSFKFTEGELAIDHFGNLLQKCGFSSTGEETMYSGILGIPLQCSVFIGPVYYQRLRHMVHDKFQVRSNGPVNPITRQPVHGRKIGGGIRFGEIERDALIAHGLTFTMQDRMFYCSDYYVGSVCSGCGSLISVNCVGKLFLDKIDIFIENQKDNHTKQFCRHCSSNAIVSRIEIPFVFQYLVHELAAMNVRVRLCVGQEVAPYDMVH